MIPFDIEYLQPDSLAQAVAFHGESEAAGKTAVYFGGGTELITGARGGTERFDVAIDIKRIPELSEFDPGRRRFGAGVRLSDLAEQTAVPLLARAARGIADRTIRNSITLGGNICGRLPYREAMLPLLLHDAELTFVGYGGTRKVRATDAFAKRLRLTRGEFLVSVAFPETAGAEGFYRRRTADSRVDYPLMTLLMVRAGDSVRFSVGGAYGYPLRDPAAEELLASRGVDAAIDSIRDTLRKDFRGSAEYRRNLLGRALEDGLEELGVKR